MGRIVESHKRMINRINKSIKFVDCPNQLIEKIIIRDEMYELFDRVDDEETKVIMAKGLVVYSHNLDKLFREAGYGGMIYVRYAC